MLGLIKIQKLPKALLFLAYSKSTISIKLLILLILKSALSFMRFAAFSSFWSNHSAKTVCIPACFAPNNLLLRRHPQTNFAAILRQSVPLRICKLPGLALAYPHCTKIPLRQITNKGANRAKTYSQ